MPSRSPQNPIHAAVSHPPRQARSRDKLDRVLAAAESLLDDQLFEELTMGAVAREAGVAVGTIYTRFKSKDELLPALFQRHDAAVGKRVGKLLQSMAAESSLFERVRIIVAFAVDYHKRHRGLLRALTMYVRSHAEGLPAKVWRERGEQYRAVAQVLVGDGVGFQDSEPLLAAEFALGVINSVCREQVLFDEVTPLRGRTGLGALKSRLTHMIHSDLAGCST